MKNKITFLTTNREKMQIALEATEKSNFEIISEKIDIPEIQDDDIEIIAKESAKYAANVLQKPIVINDQGLFIEVLNGFPGPYSKYVEDKLTPQKILRLMDDEKNRKAYYKSILAYCEPNKEPLIFTAFTYGRISNIEDGENGFCFDKIFICGDDEKTMANFTSSEMASKYSKEHWKKLITFLDSTLK